MVETRALADAGRWNRPRLSWRPRAAQRAAEQRAEAAEHAYMDGVQGMLAELTRRLPVVGDGPTPGTADAGDGITDEQEKRT
ncbi:hypothetical protein ABZ860_31280 [Microbispora sp. NPDC046973]|uniref:hypothetical protein n=1 Tax=Microbispora sp. NPDC046973 TaxID=3155022 RepID=UPI0033DBF4D6